MSNWLTLTQLIHDDDVSGALRLYIYDKAGYHTGGIWFRKKVHYPDEEIASADARKRADAAIAEGREVRITNGADYLVFHSVDGRMIYPRAGTIEEFWQKVEATS